MIRVKEAVVVEGKYDQIKLSSIIDGLIIQTNGFRIFKDKEQMKLLRKLADARGLLILTDSDAAGFQIRNYLTGAIGPAKVKHAYIPDLFGKEQRKDRPGKEGKLGVEGVPKEVLLEALRRAGVVCEEEEAQAAAPVTKQDLFFLGLSGGQDSAEKRARLMRALDLPEHLSANALVGVVNSMMGREAFLEICQAILEKNENIG